MSAALKAMVEAIWAEIDRQIRAEGIRDHVSTATRFDKSNYLGETHPNVARIQGNVDLEKVARAGLVALRNLDGEAKVDLILAGASMNDSVGIWWPVLVDSILEPAP
jgi:hypothetical protein